MKGFDTTIKNFRVLSNVRYKTYIKPCFRKFSGGSSGREKFKAEACKPPSKLDDSCLVPYAEKGSGRGCNGFHGLNPLS
jgi:hypothetical protein